MWCKNIAGRFFGLVTKHACDGRMDGQTDGQNYDFQDRASIDASRGKMVFAKYELAVIVTCFTEKDGLVLGLQKYFQGREGREGKGDGDEVPQHLSRGCVHVYEAGTSSRRVCRILQTSYVRRQLKVVELERCNWRHVNQFVVDYLRRDGLL